MKINKILMALAFLTSSYQFAAEINIEGTETQLLKAIETCNNNSERGDLQIELGSYYYLNNKFQQACYYLEEGVNSAKSQFIVVAGYLTLGKMYSEGQCNLLENDKFKFSYDFKTQKGEWVPNGKTEMDKAKFCFEYVIEFHKYFRFRNPEFATPIENAKAQFFLAQIYYNEFNSTKNNEIRAELTGKIHTLLQYISTELLTEQEKSCVTKIQNSLPKFRKSPSGRHLEEFYSK